MFYSTTLIVRMSNKENSRYRTVIKTEYRKEEMERERKEMFYLTTHSTHFI